MSYFLTKKEYVDFLLNDVNLGIKVLRKSEENKDLLDFLYQLRKFIEIYE